MQNEWRRAARAAEIAKEGLRRVVNHVRVVMSTTRRVAHNDGATANFVPFFLVHAYKRGGGRFEDGVYSKWG